MRARKDLKRGDLLLKIPYALLLSSGSLPESSKTVAEDLFRTADSKARLVLGLLLHIQLPEKSCLSRGLLSRYLSLFPVEEFEGSGPQAMLVTQPPENLHWLDGSSLQLWLFEQQECMKREFLQVFLQSKSLSCRSCVVRENGRVPACMF